WNLVELGPCLKSSTARMRQNRLIERASDAACKAAVDRSECENTLAVMIVRVKTADKDDLRFRQGASFVRAQHVHGSEIVNGSESFDDNRLRSHAERTTGQRDGDDHRQ